MSNENNIPIKKYEFHANELVINRYRVIKRIGIGGMNSIVYLAEDTQIKDGEYFSNKNKYVAIKVINRDDKMTDDD
jgi:serine/threonine protein kinase